MRAIGLAAVAALILATTALAAAKAGDLDASFDRDGKVQTDFGASDYGFAVAAQTDGRVVVAGSTHATTASFAVARYTVSGALDPTFDGDGKVTTAFTPTSVQTAYAVAIQPDGKILVAGTALGAGFSIDFAVARYNSNGSLDASFDGDGKVVTDFNRGVDSSVTMALQPDGKIVVAGSTRTAGAVPFDVGVARYNPNGSLDTSFDGDGRAIMDVGAGTDDHAQAVAVQPDGRIVVGGWLRSGATSNAVLVRYMPDGSLDNSFDGDGKSLTTMPAGVYALDLQGDGKIVTAGEPPFTVSRFNANGSVDTSFSGDGTAGPPFAQGAVYAVKVQRDGKIVAAGPALSDFGVARFNPGGAPDAAFGVGGAVRTDFGGNEALYGLALLANGKIVAVGLTEPASGSGPSDVAVARFLGAATQKAKPKPKKVVLCHKGKTIKVLKSAVKKHRKHGDKLGPCKKKKRR
jgi:uncharacterized delta-60 repeat protein